MPSPKRVSLDAKSVFYKHLSVENISMLDVSEIIPDPEQPRKKFDDRSLKELAESIKQKGLLQPIIVRKDEEFYKIISGERRFRACKLLEMEKVPCIIKAVRERKEIREIQIIENLQREDISQIERSKALREYISIALNIPQQEVMKIVSYYRFNKTSDEEKEILQNVFETVGKSARTIERWLVLLNLPEDIQIKIDSPDSPLTAKHIENIIKLKDEDLVREVISLIEKENLSSEETKEIVEKLQNKEVQKSSVDILLTKVRALGKKMPLITDEKEKEATRVKLTEIRDFIEGLLRELI